MPYKSKTIKNEQARIRYKRFKENSPFKHKCLRAKRRALELSVDYNLTPEYLESLWTGICPVLGIDIHLYEVDRSDENTAELDRFIPSKGYTQGNVNFLSRRANRLKNNVSTKELQQLIDWMKQYEN